MPITRNTVVAYTLMIVLVDMKEISMTCTFVKTVEGEAIDKVIVRITGNEMIALLGAQGSSGKPRGNDITDAVYEYALSSGAIAGVIS